MKILVIEHLSIEPLGLIGEVLERHGVAFDHFAGHSLDLRSLGYEAVIVMGGPMSANDTHLPFIRIELALIGQVLEMGLPILGICLGAQMMARAAGGNVTPSPVRELGWYPVLATAAAADDLLFSSLPPAGLTVFQWHGETFSLPDTATLLATHPTVPHQAFRLGEGQYGLQFHVEVDEAIIESWIEYGDSERRHLGPEGVARVRAGMSAHLPAMQQYCREMTANWLKLILKQ